jgi:hypothetical protein
MEELAICKRNIAVPSVITAVILLLLTNPRNTKD